VTTWVDGRIVPDDAPVVRADDHGLLVGDGVFETCEVRDGAVFALTRHLRRLRASADCLGLEFDEDRVRGGITAVLAASTLAHARLRVTVTGGPSPYGSARGESPPTVLVVAAPLGDWPPTTDVAVVPWTRNERAATVGAKTTSYADNVVALRYANERGAGEAIFANNRGELCEGTGSNVVVEHEGRLVTPPLSSGCLAGITRELLLEWAISDGVEVVEADLGLDDLRRATEVLLTSSTRDVQPVHQVDDRRLDAPGALGAAAAELFRRRAAESIDP